MKGKYSRAQKIAGVTLQERIVENLWCFAVGNTPLQSSIAIL